MSVAASNRGTRAIARQADAAMAPALRRADALPQRDEASKLREHVAELEATLRRARRCVAELRRSKTERIAELREQLRVADCAISMLTKIAFPQDRAPEMP